MGMLSFYQYKDVFNQAEFSTLDPWKRCAFVTYQRRISHSCCGVPLPLQGLMFGYATDETEESMPLTIILAHKLNAKMAEFRRKGVLPWLRPDSKTQVAKC